MDINFDHKESIPKFFAIALGTIVLGLVLGGVIDALTRKLQKDGEWQARKYSRALQYFLLQASLNIALLIALAKSSRYFVPWFQLSVSGALFAVLLFSSQRNLLDNALRVTNF